MKISKDIAAKLAREIPACANWDELRDRVHLQTGGDLDATQLDLLTDWVMYAQTYRED